MCYTLQKIFVNTPDGPAEFITNISKIVLNCPMRPEQGFHALELDTFLTPEVHKYILHQMALSNIRLSLLPVQRRIFRMLSQPNATILQVPNCSFFFSPRWYDGGKLCGYFQNGNELVQRLDSEIQEYDHMELNTVAIRARLTDEAGAQPVPANRGEAHDAFVHPNPFDNDDSSAMQGCAGGGLYSEEGTGEMSCLTSQFSPSK